MIAQVLVGSVFQLSVILKILKGNLVEWLEFKKVQTRNYFAGNILMHPAYSHLDDYRKYPNANLVLDRVFWIGVSPLYTEEIFDYIDYALREFNEKKQN